MCPRRTYISYCLCVVFGIMLTYLLCIGILVFMQHSCKKYQQKLPPRRESCFPLAMVNVVNQPTSCFTESFPKRSFHLKKCWHQTRFITFFSKIRLAPLLHQIRLPIFVRNFSDFVEPS